MGVADAGVRRRLRVVLLVDDDDTTIRSWKRDITLHFSRTVRVVSASDCTEALRHTKADTPDLALVDQHLLAELRVCAPSMLTVLTSSDPTYDDARRAGPATLAVVPKPKSWSPLLSAIEAGDDVSLLPQQPTISSLDSIANTHILRVLRSHGDNIAQTAQVLGVDRRGLQRKLKKLGVTVDRTKSSLVDNRS